MVGRKSLIKFFKLAQLLLRRSFPISTSHKPRFLLYKNIPHVQTKPPVLQKRLAALDHATESHEKLGELGGS